MRPTWMAREYDCRGIDAANDYAIPTLLAILLVVGFVMALTDCHPVPTAPPVDDPVIVMPDGASLGTPEQRACSVLSALSCPEGASAHCVDALRAATGSNVSAVNIDCILASTTKGAVRGCGVRCSP